MKWERRGRTGELEAVDADAAALLADTEDDQAEDYRVLRIVGVVIEAEHTCMTLRGVQAPGSRTITSALLGSLREDSRSRQEFFALSGIRP